MSNKQEKTELYAIIRIRGTVNVQQKVKETLKMLRVERPNYMTLIPNSSSYRGMLKKAKDAITWGEINKDVLVHVLKKRGQLEGRNPLTDEYLKENTDYESISAFADALLAGEASLKDIPTMKQFFRLHPARKGYRGVKRGFAEGGELGYRGIAINPLIVRMA